MNKELMFSSKSAEWSTPQDLFDKLNAQYSFTLDVCASVENAKCKYFYSVADSALDKEWSGMCWMNPPYGSEISKWIEKAYNETRKDNCVVVALLPSRTDTKYFHTYIYNRPGIHIEFLKGRLKFGGCKNAAPFPSMIVIFSSAHQNK